MYNHYISEHFCRVSILYLKLLYLWRKQVILLYGGRTQSLCVITRQQLTSSLSIEYVMVLYMVVLNILWNINKT